MALLAIVLVRYHRVRAILLTERRDWPDRLIFAAGLGIPLTAGVVARLLLNYNAADLTLEGAFLAGLIAGPYAGRHRRASWSGFPPIAGECIALPFAVGCGFAGGGLRELCPKEAIWHFSPFVFTGLPPARCGSCCARSRIDWQVILLLAPIGLELLRQALGDRFGVRRACSTCPTRRPG